MAQNEDLDLTRDVVAFTAPGEQTQQATDGEVDKRSQHQWWNWVARQKIDSHLPIHGLRDSFGTWVYETYGVKQAQEWPGPSDPATTLRHYVRLTTTARAKAVAGLAEVTRAALDAEQAQRAEEDGAAPSNVVALAGRRGRTR